MKIQVCRNKKLIILPFFIAICLLNSPVIRAQETLMATYSSGDLPLDYNGLYNDCSGEISITLPSGGFYEVTGIDVEYSIEAVGEPFYGFINEQNSRIYFTNESSAESWFQGSGFEPGTQEYSRSEVDIANGVYSGGTELIFQLQAYRTYGFDDTDCNTDYQKILNNTWEITVHYQEAEEITCPKPSGLSADNITTEAANLSWTENGSALEWEVKHGEKGFDAESEGNTIPDLTNTSTNLTGLDEGTEYDFYVRAICGTDDLSDWAGPYEFQTDFEPISNDECSGAIAIDIGDSKNGTTQGATTTISNCSSGKEVWYTLEGNGNPVKVQMETSDIDGVLVLFQGTSCSGKSEVSCHDNVFTKGGESFTFNSENGTTYYLSVGDYQGAYEGSFTLNLTAGCGPVDNFQVSDYPDANSVTLSWTEQSTGTELEIKYGPVGFNVNSGGTSVPDVTGSSHTLTGLTADTQYDVYIRSVCDDEEYGDWSYVFAETITDPIDNDLCSNAISINCGSSYSDQQLKGATVSFPYPQELAACVSSTEGGIWYKYTNSGSTKEVKLDFDNYDNSDSPLADFDLNVSIVAGSNCNFDATVSCYSIDKLNNDPVVFTAYGGEMYYIYISYDQGRSTQNVTFDMDVSCGDYGTTNYRDICAEASTLSCGYPTSWDTERTTDNLDDAICDIGRGVWYQFEGTGDHLTIDIKNDETSDDLDFNGYLAKGTCSGLNKIICLKKDGDENYSFDSESGVQYYLYVGIQGNESYETGEVEVELNCSSCPPIELLNYNDDTDREIRISWYYQPDFTDWIIKYGEEGFDPDTEGITVSPSQVDESSLNQGIYYLLINGLTPNTEYEIYIKPDCNESEGEWEKIKVRTSSQPSISDANCTDRLFTDTGGKEGDYSEFEDYAVRYSGNDPYVLFIKADIDENSIYGCEDFLSIYNGNSFESNTINSGDGSPYWCADNLTGELFHGSTGDLTFKFHSGNYTDGFGWEALVACDGNFTKTDDKDECLSSETVDVGYGGYAEWHHLYNNDGILIASIQPLEGTVGNVTASAFVSSENRELDDYTPYLDRSFNINTTSNGTAKIRLYFTSSEANNLISRSSETSAISDFTIIRTEQSCGEALNSCRIEYKITGNGTLANTPYVEMETSSYGAFYIVAKDEGELDIPVNDTTLILDENGMASVMTNEIVTGLSGNCHVKNFDVSPLTFDCEDLGDNEVTITVTTNDDHTIIKKANIRILDHIPPEFTSTPDPTVLINNPGDVPAIFPIGYEDNCSAEINFEEIQTDVECGFNILRKWTITDPSGNAAAFEQTIIYDGELKQDLTPVAEHMIGLTSGDTLHIIDCLPFEILGSDLNAGRDPNANIRTNLYRLELPSEEDSSEHGLMSLFEYEYMVTNECGQSYSFTYYLALYDLDPPVFRSFPNDITISSWKELPPVDDQVEIIDICNSVKWDTVYSIPQLAPLSGDTISLIRRWIAIDPSGNIGYRDQYININGSSRSDFGEIKLSIGKEHDIQNARFIQGAGTNEIPVKLMKYNPLDSLDLIDSLTTDNWHGQKGRIFFSPLQEGIYQLEINLPDGFSVRQPSVFSSAGFLDSLTIIGDTVADLGLITLVPIPAVEDSLTVNVDSGISTLPTPPLIGSKRITSKIYPNPSNGIFRIEVDSKNSVEYSIWDLSGRFIRKGSFESQTNINISSVPRGVYTIQLTVQGERLSVEKLVKME
ncbi:fibronectin type III domain-containing protein [Membranihabitans maritimus]|uniref:fibronectin type III domain-containing protein n=1 Tax=Membranihabitans maritimus TaxID=2904244 RepID=UPI001EFF8E1A|nr:fibronectin type III domain-containing protein [Membranihabitans maritimus]